MASTSSHYCLRWSNYLPNMLAVFEQLFKTEEFTDVTLWLDRGKVKVKCHKIILAACSHFFEDIFSSMSSKSHADIVLTEIKYTDIRPILDYIYRGEINIDQDQLQSMLKTANYLKIKGLFEETNSENHEENVEESVSPPPAISTSTMSSAVQSSNQFSVPQSTHGSYNLYEKPEVDYSYQLFPKPHWLQSERDLPSEQAHIPETTFEGTSRSIKEEPSAGESPIIRNILGQSRADYSDELQVQRPDSYEKLHRPHSNESATEHTTEFLRSHSLYADVPKDDDKSSLRAQKRSERQDSVSNAQTSKEWKKYKKYTGEELEAALQAMRMGLSPIAVSKQFKIPSRTLYDKAKKFGIPTKIIRRSNSGSAAFPTGIGRNINSRIYRGTSESEYESTSAIPTEIPSSSEAHETDQLHEDAAIEVSLSSPSPEIQSSTSDANTEAAAEDLSVKSRRDGAVILPTPKR